MKETFFQICIYITICMFLFNLSVSWVSGLGIYGDVEATSGIVTGNDFNQTLHDVTISPDETGGIGVDWVFAAALTGAGIVGLAIAWATHSTAIIGVFVFSAAFWAAYINTFGILNLGNFLDPGFILIATAGMGMIWIGSIAGMLSGSG